MKNISVFFIMALLTISTAAQKASWNTGVDAAIYHQQRNRNYFFKDHDYTRLTDTKVDPGYPIAMPGGWQGLPTSWQTDIDAAVYHKPYEKAYFFKGNQYIRLTGIKADSGYPRKLPGGWKGLPGSWHSGIDAAFYYPTTKKLYFFKGDQYLRITGVNVDPGYPKKISAGWQGLPAFWYSGIDAAIFRKGHIYFFKGNQYTRFTGTKLDKGYPKPLPGGWKFQEDLVNNSASQTIDFERLSSGETTRHNQPLRFEYQAGYGVSFPQGIVVVDCAVDQQCVGPTSSKVIRTSQATSEFARQPLVMQFAQGRRNASVLVSPDTYTPMQITMRAFNTAGQLLDEHIQGFGASERNANKQLRVANTQSQISKVEITAARAGQSPHNFFTADQLVFEGMGISTITDRERPQISILQPAQAGMEFAESLVPFRIRVTENEQLASVAFKVVHNSSGTVILNYSSARICGGSEGYCPSTILDRTFPVSLDQGLRWEGNFQVTFKACDRSGNCSETSRSLTYFPEESSTDEWVKAISYNVQFLTPRIDIGPIEVYGEEGTVEEDHWPNTEERARAIGRQLAAYDIIALQETINNTRRNQIMAEILREAQRTGRYKRNPGALHFAWTHGPDSPGGTATIEALDDIVSVIAGSEEPIDLNLSDDEITLISRFPILSTHQHKFSRATGADRLSPKGILHARLWKGLKENADISVWPYGTYHRANEALDVFVTHLNAGDFHVQIQQVRELANFINQHSEPGVPIVLMGDFNIDGLPAQQKNAKSHYNQMMTELGRLGLTDIGTSLGRTDVMHNKRLDYILVRPATWGGQQQPFHSRRVEVQEFPDKRFPERTMSDHFGVSAELRWNRLTGTHSSNRLRFRITRLEALSQDACNQFMDFQGVIGMNLEGRRQSRSFGVLEGNDIGPNWEVSMPVNRGDSLATIIIEIEDEDDAACGQGTDNVDINPKPHPQDLALTVDLKRGLVAVGDRLDYEKRTRQYWTTGGGKLIIDLVPPDIFPIGTPITVAGAKNRGPGVDENAEWARITFVVELVD